MKKLIDVVVLGKVCVAGSQFVLVVVAPIFLEQESLGYLFSVLAWASILAAVASFGGNAALSQYLNEVGQNASAANVTVLIILKICILAISSFGLIYFGKLEIMMALMVFFSALCAGLSFIDYVAESNGEKVVNHLSFIKIVVFPVLAFVKIAMLVFGIEIYLWILYIDWLFVWGATLFFLKIKHNKTLLGRFSLKDLFSLFQFIKRTNWVWLSSVCQLSWSRGFFIILSHDIGVSQANLYYIFLRLVEAFSFIPNAVSMRYFSIVLEKDERERVLMLEDYVYKIKKIALFSAFVAPVILFFYGRLESVFQEGVLIYFFLSLCAFVSMLRISLSREIVLKKVLHFSLVSYVGGILLGYTAYILLGANSIFAAIVSYTIYVCTSFALPLLLSPRVFFNYRKALWGSNDA